MKLSAEFLDLKLRHAFTIARGSSVTSKTVLVRLRSGRHTGFGEGSPTRYYKQTDAGCLRDARAMAKIVAQADPFDVENILDEAKRRWPRSPAARCALDIALHDLIGKITGLPLWKYWGLDPAKTPQTSFTIGIDTLEMVRKKVAEAQRFPVLKIKLGVEGDMDIIREVRKLCPKKTLRVDANCGWTVNETVRKARILEKLGVEFVEQPIPPGNNAALKRIKDRIGIGLMTDESSLTPEDIVPLAGCVDGINIKLTKCGGLRDAMKMVHLARGCGLKIMIGCMIESSVMITAGAHLTPLLDYADLDGHILITNDPFKGMRLDRNAKIVLPKGPGLGVTER